jgi:hypothetical protein
MPKKSSYNIGTSGFPVITVTAEDARIIKGMLHRGDRQHDIAAYFGCYPVEVHLIFAGKTFRHAPVAQARFLPPPGPYIYEDIRKGHKNLLHRVEALLSANKLAAAQNLIEVALNSI